MKQITMVVVAMCALSAFVSYPSAQVPGQDLETLSPLAMSMLESRSLPIEAYDAV